MTVPRPQNYDRQHSLFELPQQQPTQLQPRPKRSRPVVAKVVGWPMAEQLDLLDLPLFEWSAFTEGGQARYGRPRFLLDLDKDLGDPLADSARQEPATELPSDWSDDAVGQLHEALLIHTLGVLNSRGNAAEKLDAVKWIFSPDVFAWKQISKQSPALGYRPVDASLIPFTFQRCCAYAGKRCDGIRDGLSYALIKKGLGHLLPGEYK